MSGAKIDQKAYLKRYLSSGTDDSSKKKKKKKAKEIRGKSITIIDASVDVDRLEKLQDDELEVFQNGEDAPQVVGVIDDRPAELRALDFKNSTRWKVIADDNGFESDLIVQEMDKDGRIKRNAKQGDSQKKKSVSFGGPPDDDDDDKSPPRRVRDTDLSPVRKQHSNRSPDTSPPRRKRRNSDASPPRRDRKTTTTSPDQSPPRRGGGRKMDSDEDLSPVRKRDKGTPDCSPPRRRGRSPSPARGRPRDRSQSPRRRNDDEDRSPPRRQRNSSRDLSPQRKGEQERRRRSSPEEIPRREKRRWDSPPRDRNKVGGTPEKSPPRRIRRDRDTRSRSPKPRSSSSSSIKKMEKTLDGKSAGLQSAKALRVETEKFKEREKKVFDSMDEHLSGRDAQVVRRDRRTGRVRDMEAEMAKERIKEEKERERKAIYDRWGKGVKQVEDIQKRQEEAQHEASKPVARYAGDTDLEDHLKRQERDGDPMLAYMREKDRERRIESGNLVVMPKYQGSYALNRFNIAPGYRWDGVDRSNGYEKKVFDMQAKKKAGEEEAYKYSVEDM